MKSETFRIPEHRPGENAGLLPFSRLGNADLFPAHESALAQPNREEASRGQLQPNKQVFTVSLAKGCKKW